MEKKDTEEYEAIFVRFSDTAEKMLKTLLIGLAVLLLLGQGLLLYQPVRGLLTGIDRLEGTPLHYKKLAASCL